MELTAANIVVQPGGKPVITKFIQTLMNPGDGVLYPNPGYPIYESQVEYFGGRPLPYRYHETATGFGIDLDQLRALAASGATAIIYNNLQNPLGCESSLAEMQAIADIAIEHDLWVLSDEAYFEMRYSGTSTSIASLPGMAERTVILYTFSKKFAMTGWRLGCAVAPVPVAEMIAKLNTNDESCTTHFVQAAGVEAIAHPEGAAPMLAELQRRRDAAVDGLAAIDGITCATPDATFYLFPNVTAVMSRMGFAAVGDFATAALQNTGVSFCTRQHFGRPQADETEQYIRLAYSGISVDDIAEGLDRLAAWTTTGGAA
jgi:aspartate/methionine/tyrosine aminotransferase